jgi:hypothetical protein
MTISVNVQGNSININGATQLLLDTNIHIVARTNGQDDKCGSFVNVQVMSGAIEVTINKESGVIQVLPIDATEIVTGLIEADIAPIKRQIWNPLHQNPPLPDPNLLKYGVIGSNPNSACSIMVL